MSKLNSWKKFVKDHIHDPKIMSLPFNKRLAALSKMRGLAPLKLSKSTTQIGCTNRKINICASKNKSCRMTVTGRRCVDANSHIGMYVKKSVSEKSSRGKLLSQIRNRKSALRHVSGRKRKSGLLSQIRNRKSALRHVSGRKRKSGLLSQIRNHKSALRHVSGRKRKSGLLSQIRNHKSALRHVSGSKRKSGLLSQIRNHKSALRHVSGSKRKSGLLSQIRNRKSVLRHVSSPKKKKHLTADRRSALLQALKRSVNLRHASLKNLSPSMKSKLMNEIKRSKKLRHVLRTNEPSGSVVSLGSNPRSKSSKRSYSNSTKSNSSYLTIVTPKRKMSSKLMNDIKRSKKLRHVLRTNEPSGSVLSLGSLRGSSPKKSRSKSITPSSYLTILPKSSPKRKQGPPVAPKPKRLSKQKSNFTGLSVAQTLTAPQKSRVRMVAGKRRLPSRRSR